MLEFLIEVYFILKMFSLAALEYHQNKMFMKVQRRILRDTLDPFDMPDER